MIEKFLEYVNCTSENFIIFDIGARDCEQSIEFYKAFPNSKIYSFECNPNTLPICRRNIQKYSDRITLIEGAVSDYDGEISFFPINQQKTITTWKDGNPGASSIFKSNGSYTVEHYIQDEIKTNCHRLDTIMKIHNISKVDLIWMDLQGAELLALKGLGDFLRNVKYIHTEVSHKAIYTGQVLYNELNNFVVSNGFELKNRLNFNCWQEDAVYFKKNNYAMITFCGGENYKNKMKIGIDSKRKYCAKNNIDFILDDENSSYYDKTRPFSWNKILMIKHYLKLYNFLFWSDADVLIKNMNFNLDKYIQEKDTSNYSFIFTRCFNSINAGNFLIKNCPETFDMLDLIYNQTQYIHHGWWEQMAIIHLLENNIEFSKRCYIEKNNRLFNSYSTELKEVGHDEYKYKDGDFLIHYCGLGAEKTHEFMIQDSKNIEVPKFDCIIVCHPKDASTLDSCVEGILNNLQPNNIFLISKEKMHDKTVWVDESSTFPFSLADIQSYVGVGNPRTGWYYQQLIKLYAPRILNLDKFVIVDADTIILNKISFFKDNLINFNVGTEYHVPYFEHMSRVFPGLGKQLNMSGICHLIPYTRQILDKLFVDIENINACPLWNAMMKHVDKVHFEKSGMSEYEIMFNFAVKYFNDRINIQPLRWKNQAYLLKTDKYMFDYVCVHSYLRSPELT